MMTLEVEYFNNTEIDYLKFYDVLAANGRVPTDTRVDGDKVTFVYNNLGPLPSRPKLENMFRKAGLEFKALKVSGGLNSH